MSLEELRAYSREPDEGEKIWLLGGLYTFKAMGGENRNAYTLVEVKGREGLAAPMHLHENEEEGFYVVDGRVTFFLDGKEVDAAQGSWAFVPRGVKHSFRVDSSTATLLLLISPGAAGHEGLFREMGEPAGSHTIPEPPADPPDPSMLAEIATRHGTSIVGPPPAAK